MMNKNPALALIEAIATCNKQKLITLLEQGIDPDADSEQGTALMVAIDMGYCPEVGILLAYGANPNHIIESCEAPLYFAVARGDEELIKLLLKHGADIHHRVEGVYSYLDQAYFIQKHKSACVLMENGLSTDDSVLAQQDEIALNWFINIAPVLFTAETGDFFRLQELLEHGSDPDACAKDNTALMYAIVNRDEAIAQLLLAYGANPNVTPYPKQESCLELAAERGLKQTVHALILAGADLNADTSGRNSPLMRAAMEGYREIVQILTDAGADVNYQNSFGLTALDIAVHNKHCGIADMLIKAGAKQD